MHCQLLDTDDEGRLIQSRGVLAQVYTADLWDDTAATLAIMREGNLDAEVQKRETELDAFGLVSRVVSEIAGGSVSEGTTINALHVMEKLDDLGYGNMSPKQWRHLVDFRILLPPPAVELLLDSLFGVCNGQVRTDPQTYTDIHNLYPKGHAWPKVFLLMETYCSKLLSEYTGLQRRYHHKGPKPKPVKTLDPKAIKLLSREPALLEKLTKFFSNVFRRYAYEAQEGESEEKKRWRTRP